LQKGYLVLQTGEVFEGTLIGNINSSIGEVVFNTSMTGYQEILTDPSYKGQLITFCYPLIGNYGWNDWDDESGQIAASGVIIGNVCNSPSHYLSNSKLTEQLKKANIPALVDVDTRSVVQTIRKKEQTVFGMITTNPNERPNHWPNLLEQLLVKDVSTKKPIYYKNEGPHIVLVDYGYKKSILHALLKEKCKVTIVPYHYSFEQIKELKPDGIIFSNGPGDPITLRPYFEEIKLIAETYPTLGICLGHQLVSLAFGGKTTKLPYGHRGGNHPVKDLNTGKVFITSQNHSFVVLEESINKEMFEVQFRNVNDQSIEGLKHKTLPVLTVQFHPEAHPGPNDTEYIFHHFIRNMVVAGGKVYA